MLSQAAKKCLAVETAAFMTPNRLCFIRYIILRHHTDQLQVMVANVKLYRIFGCGWWYNHPCDSDRNNVDHYSIDGCVHCIIS